MDHTPATANAADNTDEDRLNDLFSHSLSLSPLSVPVPVPLPVPLPLSSSPCLVCGFSLPPGWESSSDEYSLPYYFGRLRVNDPADVNSKVSFWSQLIRQSQTHLIHSVPQTMTITRTHNQQLLGFSLKDLQTRFNRQGAQPQSIEYVMRNMIREQEIHSIDDTLAYTQKHNDSQQQSSSPLATALQVVYRVVSLLSPPRHDNINTQQLLQGKYAFTEHMEEMAQRIIQQATLHSKQHNTHNAYTMEELSNMHPYLSQQDLLLVLGWMIKQRRAIEIVDHHTPSSLSTQTMTEPIRVFKLGSSLSVQPLDYDRACVRSVCLQLSTRIDIEQKKQQTLESLCRSELRLARRSDKDKERHRQRAKLFLLQTQQSRKRSDTLQAQRATLLTLIDTLDQAHEQQQVIESLAKARDSLRLYQSSSNLSIDKISELMDELTEQREQIEQVNDLLSAPSDSSSSLDAECEQEYEQMMTQLQQEQEQQNRLEQQQPPTRASLVANRASVDAVLTPEANRTPSKQTHVVLQ